MIPEQLADILQMQGFAHIATVGPKGEPQTTPVWYLSDGESFQISMTPQKQKYRNLMRDPRIAVSILDPNDSSRYLEIRGEASFAPDADYEFVHRLARKYTGDDYKWLEPDEERLIVTITVLHTTGL